MAANGTSMLSSLRQRLINQRARDAVRFALQSAAAAAATFAAARLLGIEEFFIAVIAAVLVVQPSVGGTASSGWNRLGATIVGTAIGLGLIAVVPAGWGTMGALALAVAVMGLVAAFQADWRYGVVPAAAIALGNQAETLQMVLERGYAVALGVGVGLAMSLVLFPQSAQARARLHLKDAIRALSQRLDEVLCKACGRELEGGLEAARNYHKAIDEARAAGDAARGESRKDLLAAIEAVEQLDGAVTIVDRSLAHEGAFETTERRALLSRLRETAVAAIRSLLEEKVDLDAEIEALDACLEEARTSLRDGAQDDGGAPAALLFGLSALRESVVETARVLARQPELAHGLKKARIITAEALPRRTGFSEGEPKA